MVDYQRAMMGMYCRLRNWGNDLHREHRRTPTVARS
jgi:hypothetical protein